MSDQGQRRIERKAARLRGEFGGGYWPVASVGYVRALRDAEAMLVRERREWRAVIASGGTHGKATNAAHAETARVIVSVLTAKVSELRALRRAILRGER